MSVYLFIALVLFVALAPLLHFLPSKRQRAVAAMREYAAVNGLIVEYRPVPARERLPRSVGDVIYYGLRLSPLAAANVRPAHWLRQADGWRSVGAGLSAPEALAELPAAVVVVAIDRHSCGVYWVESGGTQSVEAIRCVLRKWVDTL